MKYSLPILALAAQALAGYTAIPTSVAASEYLNDVTGLPASATGKLYTSLASALYSVDVKYFNADKYKTVQSDLLSAAAKATDATKVIPELAQSTLSWSTITAAPWYDKNMPKDDKKYISSYISEWSSAYEKVLGEKSNGKDDKKNAAAGGQHAAVLAAGAAVAGFVGVAVAM